MSTYCTELPYDAQNIVDVKKAWALRYWTHEIGVTERDLRQAVEAVGPVLSDVRRLLAR